MMVIDKNKDAIGAHQIPARFISELHASRTLTPHEESMFPRISVIMPSYNQSQYIERSILSVLNQNYPNLDFIIIDGGSTDGTVDIIRKYSEHLSYWISEPDHGQSDALNKGFARATGDIYAWLNSDDIYTPRAFEHVIAALAASPDKKVVYGDYLFIDPDDRTTDYQYAFDFNLNQFKYEGWHIWGQSMFWRREVHKRFGGFDIRLHKTMDYQMILEFGLNEGQDTFLRIPVALGCFRRHADQKTQAFTETDLREHRLIASRYRFNDKYGPIGDVKRVLYRFRRIYWYVKRDGVSYLWGRLMRTHR
jgi:glycosyltransferase involved in cell wall biosynthesis